MHIHAGLKTDRIEFAIKMQNKLQSKLLASANLTCTYANGIKEGLK